ncbi:hypothetical protein EW146_g8072 [Bondarzewia mesenterica]|uniref:R3H domain-containing protein n=1 Tax=Bondarzewia mesenterica TaxID=1095465 RepID=A0A4S4LHX2_9AGAM|nr:hypothetical protein EW146_g8072 [Bondarzewia mesenterica]
MSAVHRREYRAGRHVENCLDAGSIIANGRVTATPVGHVPQYAGNRGSCVCRRIIRVLIHAMLPLHVPKPSPVVPSSPSLVLAVASSSPYPVGEVYLRNARLAEALGIDTDAKTGQQVVYHDELAMFAKANVKFLALVEKTLAEFVTSDKKVQVLPHMPPERRKFVHDLAAVYRMDIQMVDQEPHRSVQLIRRLDTRIPTPLLSSTIGTLAPSNSLGKLADLRTPVSQWPRVQTRSPATSSSSSGGVGGGWTSVVARSAAASPSPKLTFSDKRTSSWAAGPSVSAEHTRRPSPAPPVEVHAPISRPASERAVEEHVPNNWEDDI